MNILSVGGRRLHISLRIERVPVDAADRAKEAHQAESLRKALLEERYLREFDRATITGRL